MSNNTLKTDLCLVAFIDILGASEMILNDSDNNSLNKIHECYDYAIEKYTEKFSGKLPIPKINIFSDNIVISLPCEDMDNDDHFRAFHSITAFCAFILVYFWIEGILVRGGISIGSFFSDNLMVWGTGLVRAHYLEEDIAIYPRIIIEPYISDIFAEILKSKMSNYICEDYDGLYFIDPFNNNKKWGWEKLVQSFANDNMERIQNTDEKKVNIIQKLKWLQKYFEYKLSI